MARWHAIWHWRWMENLWADLRFALHQLRRSPGYGLTAIVTLTIGIGANAAIFTLIDDIMLRSLPVTHPEQLVEIGFLSPSSPYFMSGQSIHGLAQLRQHTRSLEEVSGWTGGMLFVPDQQGTVAQKKPEPNPKQAQSIPELRQQLEKILHDTHAAGMSIAIVHRDGPEIHGRMTSGGPERRISHDGQKRKHEPEK